MIGHQARKLVSVCIALLVFFTAALAQPSNDDCAGASVLCNGVTVNGSTVGATEECGGADSDCMAAGAWAGCYDVQGSVWFQFETVPGGGSVSIDISTLNSANPTDHINVVLLAASQPCNPGTYNAVSCLADTVGSFTLSGNLAGNTAYLVQVANTIDSVAGSGTNFSISASGPGMTPAFTETVTPPSCPGTPDGSAHVGTNFGIAPYNYQWSNGVSGQTTGGLTPGSYTVTVTDSVGCEATHTITVTEQNPISVQFFAQPATCGMADGAVSAQATGAQPFAYAWSTGANTQAITGLTAGTYTLTLSDANGCLFDTAAVIDNTGGPSLTVSTTDATCPGNADGSASVTATGGTTPYTYTWSDPASQTTVQAINLAEGTYFVTVEDASGCQSVGTANVGAPPPLTTTSTSTPETCTGADGTASTIPAGGTGPYTFAWTNNETTQQITGLVQGNYGVTITDANGCTVFEQTVVGQQTQVNNLELVPEPTGCDEATGSITANAIGGTFPYAYALDGAAAQLSNQFTGLPLGTYSVEVTDANGCTATQSTVIVEPERPEVTYQTTNAPCEGNEGGTVQVVDVIEGQEPMTYTIGSSSNTNGNFTNVPAGNTIMSVTDANNCTSEFPVVVFPACLTPAASFTPNGDGINDTWSINGANLFPSIEIFVYNRWGQRVFHRNGYPNEWNGKSKGVLLAASTYYYVIYYDSSQGKSGGFIKGSVTIIR